MFNNVPRLKFTFDIRKSLEKTNIKKNFSEITLCDFDKDNLITQSKIYKILLKLYKTDKQKISNAFNNGFCTPCALYNSFPFIFEENLQNVAKLIYDNLEKDKFANVKYITNKFSKLLHVSENIKDSYKLFESNIQQNKSVVITYQYSNINPKYIKKQHTISLFGYDENSVYYYENSDQNILFYSLACYLRDYLANFNNLNETIEESIKKQFLDNNSNEQELLDIAEKILGYKKLENGLSMLNRYFLTDEKIFFDTNQIITCIDDNSYNNYVNSIKVERMDSLNLSLVDSGKKYENQFNFTNLTNRLKNLSF